MSKKPMPLTTIKKTVAEFYTVSNAIERAVESLPCENPCWEYDKGIIAKAVIADPVLPRVVSYWPMLTPDVKAVIAELLPREGCDDF